ncbi:MAG: SufD family Fe-S cluster assembly protein [Hyphomicrobiaceae bacterium]
MDPEMLFYLRSRGIPEAEARAMLIESFAGETFERIENEALREALRGVALAWLRHETV